MNYKIQKYASGGSDPGEIAKRAVAEDQEQKIAQAVASVQGLTFGQAFAQARKAGLKEFT